jgi:hypothetical protein
MPKILAASLMRRKPGCLVSMPVPPRYELTLRGVYTVAASAGSEVTTRNV